MRSLRKFLAGAAMLLSASAAPLAGAQGGGDKAVAQALFSEALKLMKTGSFAEACPKLEMSQEISMAKRLTKHNAPWTATDLKKLRWLAKMKLSARLAAKEVGRTAGAVKYKAMVEGLRFQFLKQPRGVQKRRARLRRDR